MNNKLSFSKILLFAFFLYTPNKTIADQGSWENFKYRFISSEGRVIDTGKNDISHSAGQGLGMLLAVAHDDLISFNNIWQWTKKNLVIQGSDLFRGNYYFGTDHENNTANRTDGDIIIAWALARAAEKWDNLAFLNAAKKHAEIVRSQLIAKKNNKLILLPEGWSFQRDGYTEINLSYWVFPAIQALNKIDPSLEWIALADAGIELIKYARVGSWKLPANWMALNDNGIFSKAEDIPLEFGYEAVYIPLYYLWGGYPEISILDNFKTFWEQTLIDKKLITILDLVTGDIKQQENVLGYNAINQLLQCAFNHKPVKFLGNGFADYHDYFSAVTYLLVQLVIEEKMPFCKADGLIIDINRPCHDGDGSQCQVEDPIPEKIKKGEIIVRLDDYVQLPPERIKKPLVRINYLIPASDHTGRGFAVIHEGKVYIIQNDNLLPEPFLDISKVRNSEFTKGYRNEMGLNGFALHPDFSKRGAKGYQLLYTAHTEWPFSVSVSINTTVFPSPSENIHHYDVISEWRVDSVNPDKVDPESQRELLRIAQPTRHHNVGQIAFDPTLSINDQDYGLLYISVGDGGWDDYVNNLIHQQGQDLGNPFGKILRIDPLPGENNAGYSIPENNPFVKEDNNILPEIWAYGLRNPKRFSWDTEDGTLYITDIGQNNIEEVNIGKAGCNYGWKHREGLFTVFYQDDSKVLPLPSDDSTFNFCYPVIQYDHDEGNAIGGGFVYRGNLIPELNGYYVFAELSRGRIFYTKVVNISSKSAVEVMELRTFYHGQEMNFLEVLDNDFRADLRLGIDETGELYTLTKRDGMVRKIVPITMPPHTTKKAQPVTGCAFCEKLLDYITEIF